MTTEDRKRLPQGNCPFCDTIPNSWGMSFEGWEAMWRDHDAGHPSHTTQSRKEGFVCRKGRDISYTPQTDDMNADTSTLQDLIDRKREEFTRYRNDIDWQEMEGPYLVDIDPEKWLTAAITEAYRLGYNQKEK